MKPATLLALLLSACGGPDAGQASTAPLEALPPSWRDAPDSNAYGPRTQVVWAATPCAPMYHRALCPDLVGTKVPRSRDSDCNVVPCPRCNP